MPINGADALRYAKELARQEGIFCGISAGATFAGAIEIATRAPRGSTILCMLPDTGERYLSTVLFEDVSVDMSTEETRDRRLDATLPLRRVHGAVEGGADVATARAKPEAVQFVETALTTPEEPVVLFALEWCEFSWSVRKMFSALGISYRSIDLELGPLPEEQLGRRYPGRAQGENWDADDPAGLCRRATHWRRDRNLRRLQRRSPSEASEGAQSPF